MLKRNATIHLIQIRHHAQSIGTTYRSHKEAKPSHINVTHNAQEKEKKDEVSAGPYQQCFDKFLISFCTLTIF